MSLVEFNQLGTFFSVVSNALTLLGLLIVGVPPNTQSIVLNALSMSAAFIFAAVRNGSPWTIACLHAYFMASFFVSYCINENQRNSYMFVSPTIAQQHLRGNSTHPFEN